MTVMRKNVFNNMKKVAEGIYEIEIKPSETDEPIVSEEVRKLALEQATDETDYTLLKEAIDGVNKKGIGKENGNGSKKH